MPYCIVETENGWTIADFPPDRTAEDAATELGGTVLDPGPYDAFEEANEALVAMQDELAEDNGTSDVPGTRAIESRETE